MNGFVSVIRDLLEESGLDKPVIYTERSVELPGWYRPEKKWDLLVVVDGCLIAAIEFKSQVGSFGNNYNDRTRKLSGVPLTFGQLTVRVLLLRQSDRGSDTSCCWKMHRVDSPGASREPHFKVFEEFRNSSYAKRYEILLTKLVQ